MENLSTHWYWMDWVLWKFQDNGLCLQLSKCEVEKDSVIYLGLKLSHNWLEHDPGKAVAIQNLPQPRTSESCNNGSEKQTICGGSSQTSQHGLSNWLTGKVPFIWGEEEEAEFQDINNTLISTPVLALPQDTGKWKVETDTSNLATGRVLSQ